MSKVSSLYWNPSVDLAKLALMIFRDVGGRTGGLTGEGTGRLYWVLGNPHRRVRSQTLESWKSPRYPGVGENRSSRFYRGRRCVVDYRGNARINGFRQKIHAM